MNQLNNTRWEKIEGLYHAALEREPTSRTAFLRQECGGDIDLRAEIESLVCSHEKGDDFLAEPDFDLGVKLLANPPQNLEANQNFGNFTILRFLGSGGMGEVYLAKDARLKRRVALKLLPPAVTKDGDRVRRFRQEARAASQIVHANVAQVYEAGEIDDNHFIAMEFVDGVTLREHLAQNSIAFEEILTIAEQIAGALKAAHETGVIHRDLKPENVMLRRDGAVKVLDFSLAKLTRRFSSFNSPAETKQATLNTEPGIVLGTATYMSPEQARGQKVDHRTDIWSFGVLLYEMLTGEPPFRGATSMDTIAAILTAELSMPNSLENSHKLRHIVGKSLQKEPAERYQSAEEILLDLKNPRLELKSAPKSARSNKSATTDVKMAPYTEKLFAVQSPPHYFNAEVKTPTTSNRRSFRTSVVAAVCLLLVVGGLGFTIQQWRQSLTQDASTVTPLTPNSSIMFQANRAAGDAEIFIMDADGSNQVNVSNDPANDYENVWSPDGSSIVFRSNRNDGNYEIYTMNADGSNLKRLTNNNASDEHPDWSPDGTKIVFHSDRDDGNYEIYVMNSDGTNQTRLTNNTLPDYSPDWSPDGSKIVFASNREDGKWNGNFEIYVMDADGSNPIRLTNNTVFDEHPAWSPDGSKIAFHSRDTGEIYLMNADGSNPTNVSNHPADDALPAWSPDGSKLAFGTNRDGNYEIYTMNVDGSGVTRLTNDTAYDNRPAWQPVSISAY